MFPDLLREAEVCTWLEDKKGAISFSIDDGWPGCRDELEQAGFRGTYYWWNYASPGVEPAWLAEYSAAGHEIGAHTQTHPCLPSAHNASPQALWKDRPRAQDVLDYRQAEIDPTVTVIERWTGKPVLSMAWPCGCTDPSRMEAAAAYFLGVRGYFDRVAGLNWIDDVNPATPHNFLNLSASVRFDASFIERAVAEGKWAIITTHEYTGAEGIDVIGRHLDDLWAAPVGDVLQYIRLRDAARIVRFKRSGGRIDFVVTHDLPAWPRYTVGRQPLLPITFDNPVTLKVHLGQAERVARVEASFPLQQTASDGWITRNLPFRMADGCVRFETAIHPLCRIAIQLD